MNVTMRERALGSLWGLALGDALGMPTQELSRSESLEILGNPPTFRDAPQDHPFATGLKAGSITDDTEQTLLFAELLIENLGVISPEQIAQSLQEWETQQIALGRFGLLGPSTKRALEELRAGKDPSETGRLGTTNGAAMRISSVGILYPPTKRRELVEQCVKVSLVTHNTDVAISGAAAVAAAISAFIDGQTFSQAIAFAIEVANIAMKLGNQTANPPLSDLIESALTVTTIEEAIERFGTSVEMRESLPMAFACLSLGQDSPWNAITLAAGVGGDTDTIGAITGAMIGAKCGMDGWPQGAISLVRRVNYLNVETTVDSLLELRVEE